MIKLKSLLTETLKDWDSGYWIHYSDVDYLKPKLDRTEGDIVGPAALFFFPYKFKVKDRNFLEKKYKITVKLKPGVKILDLGTITPKLMLRIAETFGLGREMGEYYLKVLKRFRVPNRFWSMLKDRIDRNDYGTNFKKLGYDAVFDDVGAIFFSGEIQLVVFDENNVEIVKIEPNDL